MAPHDFSSRIENVRHRIETAASRSGRNPADITLVAVSKTAERPAIDTAYECGLRVFGENRVQDAVKKFDSSFPADAVLHMIGSLQRNKAGKVVDLFDLVHSVDRDAIAKELAKQAQKRETVQSILIEVNVAGEEQKAGCPLDQVGGLIEFIQELPTLSLRGFMTMAPLTQDAESIRWVFHDLKVISDRYQTQYPGMTLDLLSMGMTNDFEIAIEEGSTHVRVGRAIFGE